MIWNAINTNDIKSMKCHFFNNIKLKKKKKPPELKTYTLIIILIKCQMDKMTFRILVVCSS